MAAVRGAGGGRGGRDGGQFGHTVPIGGALWSPRTVNLSTSRHKCRRPTSASLNTRPVRHRQTSGVRPAPLTSDGGGDVGQANPTDGRRVPC